MGGPLLPPPRQKKLLPVGDAEAGLNARERSLRDDPTKQWQWARWDVETAIKQAVSPRLLSLPQHARRVAAQCTLT